MFMLKKIVAEIAEQTTVTNSEHSELIQLLAYMERQTAAIGLSIPEERWISIGHHMLALIRRVHNEEFLEPIDQQLMNQVSTEMKQVSQRILQHYCHPYQRAVDDTEVLLLAVHFAAAKQAQAEVTKEVKE